MKAISRFVIRAPLLPLEGKEELLANPLGRLAIELASPSLAKAAPGDARAARALARYASRARFRPTPSGLLAGVAVGKLGKRTAIDTGTPEPHLTVAWGRLAAMARALLDDPEARAGSRLRAAPSLLRHGDHVMWLGSDGTALEAEVNELLDRVLAAARRFAPWRVVEEAAGDDEVLLGLVDDGLLVSDLTPPLVGPAPLAAMIGRLGRRREVKASLMSVARSLAEARPAEARATLATLPGAGEGDPLHATLVFRKARVTLAAEVVERAAALAPILVRLCEALVPPVAERDLVPPVAAEAAAELVGQGTLDLGALALGGYGVRADEPGARPETAIPRGLLRLLVDKIAAASASGAEEIVLDPSELDAVLPPARVPETVELFLVPRREEAGETPGSGWLLGLHAPAGATWGRFAHALGAPLAAALEELARAEPRGRLDVAWTPDAGLANLCAHPPVREVALALVTWPDGPSVTPAEMGLVAPPPLEVAGGTPSPLWRIRSTMAPPGVYQMLTGWSLQRQHAPWALAWGALGELAWLPRVRLGGFVISPQSWRLPATGLPFPVQVGHEDELLLVESAEELTGERAWEIWPPLDEGVDASGRRVEAVVAIAGRGAAVGVPPRVPAPSPVEGWRTFKLFGPSDRQDRVLLDAVLPAITAAREAREIDGWFYLRYVEGARHHLRVRVRGDARAFAAHLDLALSPARDAGDVVTVEETPYFREVARYGARGVEGAFSAASDLACELLATGGDPEELAVAALDAHAQAAGLSLAQRHALAAELRAAHEPVPADAAATFRARSRRLHEVLTATDGPSLGRKLPRAVLGDLLHMCANRLLGVDPERETLAVYLWERALEGLRARASTKRRGGP